MKQVLVWMASVVSQDCQLLCSGSLHNRTWKWGEEDLSGHSVAGIACPHTHDPLSHQMSLAQRKFKDKWSRQSKQSPFATQALSACCGAGPALGWYFTHGCRKGRFWGLHCSWKILNQTTWNLEISLLKSGPVPTFFPFLISVALSLLSQMSCGSSKRWHWICFINQNTFN